MPESARKKHNIAEQFYYMNLGATLPIQLADMGITMAIASQTPELMVNEKLVTGLAYEHFGIVGIPLIKLVLVPAMIFIAGKLKKDADIPGWTAAALMIVNMVTAIVTVNNAILLAQHLAK